MRPPPPSDYVIENPRTQTHVQQRLFTKTANNRPNNLRFPYAVTPRLNNKKSFFHQSTNEQTPTTTVMETIWFQDKDPRTLNSPHNSNYNPLLSYRNWAKMPFDSREYNFFMAPLHKLKYRVSEYFPPLPPENTNTVKRSTKNMGRDKLHQTMYPIIKQFYSLTDYQLFELIRFDAFMVKYQDRYWIETNAEWTTVQKPDIQEKIKLNKTASIATRFEIYPIVEHECGSLQPLHKTEYDDIYIIYEYGFDMHTGQKVTRKKDKFDDEKFIKITPKQIISTHTRYEDEDNNQFYCGFINENTHLNMKMDLYMSNIYSRISLQAI